MHNALTALTLDVGIKGEECCARAFDASGVSLFSRVGAVFFHL